MLKEPVHRRSCSRPHSEIGFDVFLFRRPFTTSTATVSLRGPESIRCLAVGRGLFQNEETESGRIEGSLKGLEVPPCTDSMHAMPCMMEKALPLLSFKFFSDFARLLLPEPASDPFAGPAPVQHPQQQPADLLAGGRLAKGL